MQRRLLLAALLMLALTVPARADFGLSAAAAALFTAIGGWGTVAKAALSIAVSIGLSYFEKQQARKAQARAAAPLGGTTGAVTTGGVIPRSFVFGRSPAEPTLTYHNSFGGGAPGDTPSAYDVQEFALADLPCKGLAALTVFGEPVTYDPEAAPGPDGIAIPEYTVGGVEHLWVRFFDGTTDTPDARMVALFGADPDFPYQADRLFLGVPRVVVTARLNRELFRSYPECTFVLDGIACYDRRLDDEAGGAGDQRLDDPATWAWTDNVAIVKEAFLRGLRFDGAWQWGGQTVGEAQLPAAAWLAAANECDAAAALAAGGTEKQFRCGGCVHFDELPVAVLDELNQCDNGRIAVVGGTFKPRSGAAGAAVVAFDDRAILTDDARLFEPFRSIGDTVNHVTARHLSPAQGWRPVDAPALIDLDLEAADGRRCSVPVDYRYVSSGTQVQRLMRAERDNNRAWRRHVLPLPPAFLAYDTIDTFAYTSSRNGYTDKDFDVVELRLLGSGKVIATLKELDPLAYDWDEDEHEQPISEGVLRLIRPTPQPIKAPTATGITITVNGRDVAACRFTWDADVDDVDGVLFEIERASDHVLVSDGVTDFWDRGALDTSQNIVGAADYRGRLKYRPASARQTTWSGWMAFTTPDTRVSREELEDILQLRLLSLGSIEDRLRRVDLATAMLARTVTQQAFNAELARAELQGDQARVYRSVTERIDLLNNTALAQEVALLLAQLAGVQALIGTVQQSVVDATNALATVSSVIGALSGDNTSVLQQFRTAGVGNLRALLNLTSLATIGAALQGDADRAAVAGAFDLMRAQIGGNFAEVSRVQQLVVTEQAAHGSDITQIKTRVTDTENTNTAQGSAITELQSTTQIHGDEISSISTSVTELESRITDAEDDIDVQATAVSGLQTTVTQHGTDITALSTATTALDARLDDAEDGIAAHGSALTTLGTQVTQHGTDITALSTATTALDARLDDAEDGIGAQASALTTLGAQVTDIDGDVTALAVSQTTVMAAVDDITASGNVRIAVGSAPTGALGIIDMVTKVGTGGTFASASFSLATYTDGVNYWSENLLRADRTKIQIPSVNGGAPIDVFVAATVGGVPRITMPDIWVENLTSGCINVDTLFADNVIVRSKIAPGTAGYMDWVVGSNAYAKENQTITLASKSFDIAVGPISVDASVLFFGSITTIVNSGFPVTLQITVDGAVRKSIIVPMVARGWNGSQNIYSWDGFHALPWAGTETVGAHTIALKLVTPNIGTGSLDIFGYEEPFLRVFESRS